MTLHLNIEFSLTIFHWLYIILFLFTNYNVFFCSFLYYSSHIDKILSVSSFASLCLETLIYPILVELMDLVNFIIIFVILNLLFLNLLYLVSLYLAVTNKPYTGWTKLHLYLMHMHWMRAWSRNCQNGAKIDIFLAFSWLSKPLILALNWLSWNGKTQVHLNMCKDSNFQIW